MPKLSDTQAVLLATAAARADLSVLPLPETLQLKGAALERTLTALIRRGLITDAAVTGRKKSSWAVANGEAAGRRLLVVTPAGLEAIGVEVGSTAAPAAAPAAATPVAAADVPSRPGGKMGLLLDAVARPEGATLEELATASGWLPHTTRAAITRLRQRGHDVRLATMGARKAYHLIPN
jgi:Protein of unknown function (DUF3489)